MYKRQAEIVVGNNIANYIETYPSLKEFAPMSGFIVAYFWGSAMVGRFIGAPLLEKVKTSSVVVLCGVCAIILIVISALNPGIASMILLLFIGIFNGVLFPTIFALGTRRMGKYTAQASGILNTAIIGGAIAMVCVNGFFDSIGGQVDQHIMYNGVFDIMTTVISESGEMTEEVWAGMPGLKWTFFFAIPMYMYIIYFGIAGYKRGTESDSKAEDE